MVATTVSAWPSLERAEEALDALSDGDHALECLLIDCHRLIDHEDSLEPRTDAPAPTLTDVAVVATICETVKDDLENMGW
jgi:hypothetical protein